MNDTKLILTDINGVIYKRIYADISIEAHTILKNSAKSHDLPIKRYLEHLIINNKDLSLKGF